MFSPPNGTLGTGVSTPECNHNGQQAVKQRFDGLSPRGFSVQSFLSVQCVLGFLRPQTLLVFIDVQICPWGNDDNVCVNVDADQVAGMHAMMIMCA